jgi:hypothetical protein
MEIKFYMHVWRKKFGGLDKKKLQKMRMSCATTQYVAIFLHKLLFTWVGEAILP